MDRAGLDRVHLRRRVRVDRNSRSNGVRLARARRTLGARHEKSERERSRSRSWVVGG